MTNPRPEHVDVLIVGAGLSGIGAACHLTQECPGKTYAILESRAASGGTWDLFRYPGIRSDSDMFTLGYQFKPWAGAKAIADGPSILDYIRETAREHRVDEKIRYHRRAVAASWSSADARWTVDVRDTGTGDVSQLTCSFLYANTGYYNYEHGYTPTFEGTDRFAGQIVHPQHWPEDLDVAGKKIVVIGSGATAVTLVPSLADLGAEVTMLQRSPSYILSQPAKDPVADALRKTLPAKVAYPIVRWKNVGVSTAFFQLCQRAPGPMKKLLTKQVAKQLPEGFDVDTHFNPAYGPWDQRLCLVPNGDLFRAIRDGKASVVTDRISTFTERGLLLESGTELEADVVVTATGLDIQLFGGMTLTVDGADVDLHETVGYKGMMFSGVPNLALTIGYTNASWTLKADLAASYVCRLLRHMDEHGFEVATPKAPDPALPTRPFLDLSSGYVQRALDRMPRQGAVTPWRLHQNYARDVLMFRRGRVDDEGMVFSHRVPATTGEERVAV